MRGNLLDTLDDFGGLAARRELESEGVDPEEITIAAWYGRRIIRVRKGWYARPDEPRDVLRAWRVGGRLTCVSALAFRHDDEAVEPVLHIEVPTNAARLRDPEEAKRRLAPDAPVVVHWAEHPGPGDRRAVTAAYALQVAARCGTRGAGVPRDYR